MGKPRLCFVGNMLGRNPGYITTQGQIVADLFAADGYRVTSVSSKLNRAFRLADIAQHIVKNSAKIDVLILEVYSGLSMLIADTTSLLCKLLKIPLILVLHGGNLPDFTTRHLNWTKRVLNRADILVAPSSFLAEEMEQFGFHIRVIPNVVDLDAYPYKLRRRVSPKLIWMRSFHAIYNPQMAINVFSSVRKTEPTATLIMAGVDKGLEPKIKEMAGKLGLQDDVRFPGFLGTEAKIKEFTDADIYLNTNRIDNMPVSVIEACAMGLPVVATNVGGIPHIIENGESGLLIPSEDVEAMSQAVSTLLGNAELTERLSRNGRFLAERSAWKSVRRDWEELFTELLETKV